MGSASIKGVGSVVSGFSQPHLENGSAYRQNRPTKLDKIENLCVSLHLDAVIGGSVPGSKHWIERLLLTQQGLLTCLGQETSVVRRCGLSTKRAPRAEFP